MSESQNPNDMTLKKRKLDDDVPGDKMDESMDASEPSEPTRCKEFWFHDGNVVLQTSIQQYRVHQSLLSLHSKVFADMFSIPQPTEASGSGVVDNLNEIVDGCPVVRIYDYWEDVYILLRVLYGLDTVRDHNVEESALVLIALLKMAQKYEFSKILKDVLKQLRRRFPASLEEFEKHKPFPSSDELLALVVAAHDFHLHSILPTLYVNLFELCSTEEIEEQLGILRGGPPGPISMDTRTLVHVLMSAQRYHLAIVKFHLPAFKFRGPSGECNSPGTCCTSFPTALDYSQNPTSPFNLTGTPFPDKEGTQLFSPHKNLCEKCRALVLPRYVGRRRHLWLDLPRLFGYDAHAYKNGEIEDFIPVVFKMT